MSNSKCQPFWNFSVRNFNPHSKNAVLFGEVRVLLKMCKNGCRKDLSSVVPPRLVTSLIPQCATTVAAAPRKIYSRLCLKRSSKRGSIVAIVDAQVAAEQGHVLKLKGGRRSEGRKGLWWILKKKKKILF